MLTAVPTRWFSWDFTVTDGARTVATIDVSWWREQGTLTVDGVDHCVYREGMLSGEFILEAEGSVVARARKPSASKYPGATNSAAAISGSSARSASPLRRACARPCSFSGMSCWPW